MPLNLAELRRLPIADLVERARRLGIDNAGSLQEAGVDLRLGAA